MVVPATWKFLAAFCPKISPHWVRVRKHRVPSMRFILVLRRDSTTTAWSDDLGFLPRPGYRCMTEAGPGPAAKNSCYPFRSVIHTGRVIHAFLGPVNPQSTVPRSRWRAGTY